MKTRFILIRHAQSAARELGIVQGVGLRVPLTPEGHRQAKTLAQALAKIGPDRIFASTALRATKTAEALRSVYPDVFYSELASLNERSKGKGEGLIHEEFARQFPHVLEAWSRGEDPRLPDGESIADLHRRVVPVLEEHLKKHSGQVLLYVVHGNVIRVLLAHILGVDPVRFQRQIAQDYCAVNIVEYDEEQRRWHLQCINQTFSADHV